MRQQPQRASFSKLSKIFRTGVPAQCNKHLGSRKHRRECRLSTPSGPPARVPSVRYYALAARSLSLSWGPVPVAFLGRWPASRQRGCIAAELLREFRRKSSHLAALGEDRAQEPDARRHRVAVAFDRVDQQVEEREGLLVGQIELHPGFLASNWRKECHHHGGECCHDRGLEHTGESGARGQHRGDADRIWLTVRKAFYPPPQASRPGSLPPVTRSPSAFQRSNPGSP